MLFQRARNPLTSRSRKCAISSFSDIFVSLRATGLKRLTVSRRAGCFCSDMCVRTIRNPIDATAFGSSRHEIEAKLLADNTCEKAADRMLLPSCGTGHRLDGRTACSSQHRDDASLLCIGMSRLLPWGSLLLADCRLRASLEFCCFAGCMSQAAAAACRAAV